MTFGVGRQAKLIVRNKGNKRTIVIKLIGKKKISRRSPMQTEKSQGVVGWCDGAG